MGNLNSRSKGNRRRKSKNQSIIKEDEDQQKNNLDDSFDLAEIDYK